MLTRKFAACLLGTLFVAAAPAADEGFVKLFNGTDLSGWTKYLQNNADPAQTWSVSDGVIHCKGLPMGYLLTEKEYGDFEMILDWRLPAKPVKKKAVGKSSRK